MDYSLLLAIEKKKREKKNLTRNALKSEEFVRPNAASLFGNLARDDADLDILNKTKILDQTYDDMVFEQ